MNSVINRMNQSTPKFFQKVRNIGLVLTAIAASLAAAPVVLPALIVKATGYLAVAGMVASAVSQSAVIDEQQ